MDYSIERERFVDGHGNSNVYFINGSEPLYIKQ